MLPEC